MREIAGSFLRLPVLAALAGLSLAACSSVSDIGTTIVSGGNAGESVADVDTSSFVAPPWCPPIGVERGKYLVMKFARGKENDPTGLEYQATIEKWATGCKRVGDQTQVTVGVSGRVTPGPAWQGGEILLPVSLTLEEDGGSEESNEASELTVPVTLGEGAPSEIWNLVETSIMLSPQARPKIVVALEEGGRRGRR